MLHVRSHRLQAAARFAALALVLVAALSVVAHAGAAAPRKRASASRSLVGSVGRTAQTRARAISGFCLDPQENLVICDEAGKAIRVVSQGDRLVARWDVDFAPQAIDALDDGTYLVGGEGMLAVLDGTGSLVRSEELPAKQAVASITHSGDDVFVCADAPSGFAVYRLDKDLQGAKRIVTGLSGCCGQMDIRARDGMLYVAENGRFTIRKYDREGKQVGKFTHSEASQSAYFGDGCCEPKNICFAADGSIYAAASGPMLVKRYSQSGKYLGRVARVPNPTGGCVRVTLQLTRDGRKLYMVDTDKNCVRLLRPAM